jgi:hypothetical protein
MDGRVREQHVGRRVERGRAQVVGHDNRDGVGDGRTALVLLRVHVRAEDVERAGDHCMRAGEELGGC